MTLTFQFDAPFILCEAHSTATHCDICKCWKILNDASVNDTSIAFGLLQDGVCKCDPKATWTWEMNRAERLRQRRRVHTKETPLIKIAIYNRIRDAIEEEKKFLQKLSRKT
jgi:hypothetical protein